MSRLFGSKLRVLRRQQDLTQVALAQKLGLGSYTHITKLEASQDAPSLDLVVRIAHLFGVTTDYLLRDSIPVGEIMVSTGKPTADPETVSHLFGKTLRTLRLQQKLTQVELRRRLGLAGQGYISNLEAGRKAPSLDLAVQIADLFGVTTDYLLCDAVSLGQNGHATEGRAEDS
jgi:transcriptional regulator with XRE-family HTH domain